MHLKFICTAKYDGVDATTGKEGTVTEKYLFEAENYGHAEKRAYEQLEHIIGANFYIKDVKKANFSDVFVNEDGKFHQAKVSFVSINEQTGKQKLIANNMLVNAENVGEAYNQLEESMEGMTVDFVINSVAESPIVEFFPYESQSQNKEE